MIHRFLLPLFFLTACGYRFDAPHNDIAISVPYVLGDFEGQLTDALIWAVARSPGFSYAADDGDWVLSATILGSNNERIGYRYDRDDKSGKRRKNVIGTENRKMITVKVEVTDAETGKLVAGPHIIKGWADYDYVDDNSLLDLSFVDLSGMRQTSIAFSLGQLDSVGAAGEDAIYPIYARLARTIVDGLMASENGS